MSEKAIFTFCPVCGQNKLQSISEKLLECGNCSFEWFQNPKVSANVVIFNSNHEILLGKRKQNPRVGFWGTIGGFLDPNETLEQAVQRETKEETGLSLEIRRFTYFGSKKDRYNYKGWNYHTAGAVFVAKITDLEANQIKPNDDVSELKFFSLDKIPWEKMAFESAKECLRQIIADLDSVLNHNSSPNKNENSVSEIPESLSKNTPTKGIFNLNQHNSFTKKKNPSNFKTMSTEFSLFDSLESSTDLSIFRDLIDEIDKNILNQIKKRMDVVQRIGNYKLAHGLAIHQPERWEEVLKKIRENCYELNLDEEIIQKIWEYFHMYSLRLEKNVKKESGKN